MNKPIPSEETLHALVVEVLLILSVNKLEISPESISFALAIRNNVRHSLVRHLTPPFEPTRDAF